jgi:hypothetical protein
MDNNDSTYRNIIDRLVEACRNGQGQIGRRRALAGLWNANATSKRLPEQHQINLLLARLSDDDRAIVARLLEEEFSAGVHSALATLHAAQLAPFDKAYEGTPFHDFVGRMTGWKWPKSTPRS